MKAIYLVLMGLLAMSTSAIAANPREELKQAVEQLRATPTDNALRERIITIAIGLKPPPAVPEEARRAFVKGNIAFTDAKTPEDVDRAISLYREASNISPWWADAYSNLAKAFEQRQNSADAIAALKLYLMAAPNGSDARAAQDKIYALEEKADRIAKAAAAELAAQQKAALQLAQRKQWAATLTQELSAMFAGKIESHSSRCHCTLQEYSGNNWDRGIAPYPTGARAQLASDQEKILYYRAYRFSPSEAGEQTPLIGTPRGPSLDEVEWTLNGKTWQMHFWWTEGGLVVNEQYESKMSRKSPGFDPYSKFHFWRWIYK